MLRWCFVLVCVVVVGSTTTTPPPVPEATCLTGMWEDPRMVAASATELNDLGHWLLCKNTAAASDLSIHYCVFTALLVQYVPNHESKRVALSQLGFCVLTSCGSKDIQAQSAPLMQNLTRGARLPSGEDIEGVAHCESFTEDKTLNSGAVGMVVVYIILGVLCCCGTVLDVFDRKEDDMGQALLVQQEGSRPDAKVVPQRPMGWNVVKAFACWHNFERLLAPGPKPTASLNGGRVISMFWIILGHTFYFGVYTPGYSNQGHVVTSVATSWDFMFVLPAVFAVDTFFWLSGFLVWYMAYATLMKKRQGVGFWFMFYFHRIFRLTPVYMFILLTWWKLVPYMGRGPTWYKVQGLIDNTCSKYWWTNLLYINNLWPRHIQNQCFGWAWYMANDLQFYLITPLFLIVYMKKPLVSMLMMGAVMVVSLILNGYLTYHELTTGVSNALTGQSQDPYVRPYTRIPAYLWGLWAAAFVHWLTPRLEGFRTEMQHPEDAPQTKIKEYLQKKWCRVLIYTIAAALFWSCMYLDWDQIRELRRGNAWSTAAQTMFQIYVRLAWGISMSLLFVMYILGYGGAVNAFLSHELWTPGARLTYTAYLVHPIIIQCYYGNQLSLPYFARGDYAILFIAFVVAAYGLAVVFFLVCEKPVMNLEKYLLNLPKMFRRKRPQSGRPIP